MALAVRTSHTVTRWAFLESVAGRAAIHAALALIVLAAIVAPPAIALAEDYVYVVLHVQRFFEYRSRYADSRIDGTYREVAAPADRATVFFKYLAGSQAAQFFAPGRLYTRVDGRVDDFRYHYGHYVAAGPLRDEDAWARFPTASWKDVSTATLTSAGNVRYLIGAGLVDGGWGWNFERGPGYSGLWRYADFDVAGRRDARLRDLRAKDVKAHLGHGTDKLLLKMYEKTKVDVPSFVRTHRALIADAARRSMLHPELVAAVLVAEQRDLEPSQHVTIRGWYVGSWAETTTDWLGSWIGRDTSIGLGQVKPSTAMSLKLLHPEGAGKSQREIARMLEEPRHNIRATARYIRIVADRGARYRGKLPADAGDQKYVAGLPLASFTGHSLDWRMGHLLLMASEYTSSPWDGKFKTGWGLAVLLAYADVLGAEAM